MNFTLFGAVYFYIPVNVLELCSRTHLSYLEMVWSLQSCFESLLVAPKQHFGLGRTSPPQRTLSPSEQSALFLWTVGTGAVSGQLWAWGRPCSSGSDSFLIPSCQVALRWRPWHSRSGALFSGPLPCELWPPWPPSCALCLHNSEFSGLCLGLPSLCLGLELSRLRAGMIRGFILFVFCLGDRFVCCLMSSVLKNFVLFLVFSCFRWTVNQVSATLLAGSGNPGYSLKGYQCWERGRELCGCVCTTIGHPSGEMLVEGLGSSATSEGEGSFMVKKDLCALGQSPFGDYYVPVELFGLQGSSWLLQFFFLFFILRFFNCQNYPFKSVTLGGQEERVWLFKNVFGGISFIASIFQDDTFRIVTSS